MRRERQLLIRALAAGLGLTTLLAACQSTSNQPVKPLAHGQLSPQDSPGTTGGHPRPSGAPDTLLPTGDPGPVPAVPPVLTTGDDLTGKVKGPVGLTGKVKMPASLVSTDGSQLVSNDGSQIISDNGAAILANNTSRYRLQDASPADKGLANAFMYLTNRDEKLFIDAAARKAFTATSDATGSYAFGLSALFPTGKDVVVNALLQGNLRLTGYVVPAAGGGTELQVDLASTLGTEYLRGASYLAARDLSSYDQARFQQILAATRSAIASGAVAAVRTDAGASGPVGVFDLRVDHVAALRNQYAVAISAVDAGNQAVKAISDAWKQLLGYRPQVVTSLFGNGLEPDVTFGPGGSRKAYGAVDGNGSHLPGTQLALGFVNGVCTSARGDVFVGCYSHDLRSGNIRWIKPDGSITSLWLPNRYLSAPVGLRVERQPADGAVGSLLVADMGLHRVFRVPIVDVAQVNDGYLDGSGQAKSAYLTEVVAGEGDSPGDDVALDAADPRSVDAANPPAAVDASAPATSRWRLGDEGDRRYANGTPVPNAARYALLNSPEDVCSDDQGNLYIADTANHRIRMIPKADGSYFNYRAPQDGNHDGVVDGFGASAVTMQAGKIYTIAGNPAWDPSRTPDDGAGRWFGEYADSDGGPAQQAHLDQPMGLAWRDGYLYVCDFDNQRVRRISRSTGVIETFAGAPQGAQQDHGQADFAYATGDSGDGGPAGSAQLHDPLAIAFDQAGRLFIAMNGSGLIRMVDTDGKIATVAGRHLPDDAAVDNSTDGDAVQWADLYNTLGLAVDPQGNVLFSDGRHKRLRKLWRQWEQQP